MAKSRAKSSAAAPEVSDAVDDAARAEILDDGAPGFVSNGSVAGGSGSDDAANPEASEAGQVAPDETEAAEAREGSGVGNTDATALSPIETAMLDLEANWRSMAPTKARAIRERLGMTPTRYYLRLAALIDEDRAYWADPVLISRLRRMRQHRLDERNRAEGADWRTDAIG